MPGLLSNDRRHHIGAMTEGLAPLRKVYRQKFSVPPFPRQRRINCFAASLLRAPQRSVSSVLSGDRRWVFPDGTQLLAALNDGTIRIWHALADPKQSSVTDRRLIGLRRIVRNR